MALRVGVAFIILMAVNVGFGIEWIGARRSEHRYKTQRMAYTPRLKRNR